MPNVTFNKESGRVSPDFGALDNANFFVYD